MAYKIRRLDYFYTQVSDQPGAAHELLSSLASPGVIRLAFTAVPVGPEDTQLTLFPEDPHRLLDAAKKAGLPLAGPHPALLVQGDDELGALAMVHSKLADVSVVRALPIASRRTVRPSSFVAERKISPVRFARPSRPAS